VDFILEHKSVVAFFSFFLFCVIALSVQSSTFTLSLEGVGSAVVSPFQNGYDSFQKGIHKLWAGFTELSDVRQELFKTREKLQKFESIAEEFSEIRKENVRLRKLLGLQQRITFDFIPAIIISKDPDNWFRTLIIDKGANDGIKVNMPVLAFKNGQKAVIGKIIEVRGSISRIIPVISPDMNVGVKFQDNRFPGLLHGLSSNSTLCIMDYISKIALIKPGEHIITSGQGGIFPPGLNVGMVIKTVTSQASSYKKAIVKPLINYNLVEQVFVIKKDINKNLKNLLEESK